MVIIEKIDKNDKNISSEYLVEVVNTLIEGLNRHESMNIFLQQEIERLKQSSKVTK